MFASTLFDVNLIHWNIAVEIYLRVPVVHFRKHRGVTAPPVTGDLFMPNTHLHLEKCVKRCTTFPLVCNVLRVVEHDVWVRHTGRRPFPKVPTLPISTRKFLQRKHYPRNHHGQISETCYKLFAQAKRKALHYNPAGCGEILK